MQTRAPRRTRVGPVFVMLVEESGPDDRLEAWSIKSLVRFDEEVPNAGGMTTAVSILYWIDGGGPREKRRLLRVGRELAKRDGVPFLVHEVKR